MNDLEDQIAGKFRLLEAVDPPDFSAVRRSTTVNTEAVPTDGTSRAEAHASPALRAERTRRSVVFAVLAAAAAIVLVIGFIVRPPAQTTDVSTDDITESPAPATTPVVDEAESNTTTVAPPTTATGPTVTTPSAMCGAAFPFTFDLVDPILPREDVVFIDQDSTLVREIMLLSGDVIQVLWPAGDQEEYDLSNGIPLFSSAHLTSLPLTQPADTSAETVFTLRGVGRFESPLGPELEIAVSDSFATTAPSPPECDLFEINITSGGESARFGFDLSLGAANEHPLVVLAPLVTSSEEISALPTAIAPCDGGLPDQAGASTASAFDTPTAALRDFLKTDPARTFGKSGFHEMITPDGSRIYGIHFDFLDRAPRSTDQFVTFITTTESETGWSVTDWSASGC